MSTAETCTGTACPFWDNCVSTADPETGQSHCNAFRKLKSSDLYERCLGLMLFVEGFTEEGDI